MGWELRSVSSIEFTMSNTERSLGLTKCMPDPKWPTSKAQRSKARKLIKSCFIHAIYHCYRWASPVLLAPIYEAFSYIFQQISNPPCFPGVGVVGVSDDKCIKNKCCFYIVTNSYL